MQTETLTPNLKRPAKPGLPDPTFDFTMDALHRLQLRPGETQRSWRDCKVTGMVVTVGKRAKTFFYEHRVKGIGIRKPKLGRFPSWTVNMARKRARELEVKMDNGIDPTELADVPTGDVTGDGGTFNPATFTVLDALTFYADWMKANGRSPASIKGIEGEAKRQLKPWWDRPVLSLKKSECHRMHLEIRNRIRSKTTPEAHEAEGGHTIGNYSANRTMKNLQTAFNKVQYEYDDDGFPPNALNPIRKGFPWFDEESRRVMVEWNELPAWWAETQHTLNEVERHVWRLTLFTGFRNSDCCAIKWSEIENLDDDGAATMYRPNPKGGRHKGFHVPLSTAALAVLRERRDAKLASKIEGMRKCPWVFPTYSKSGMLTHIRSVNNQETVNGKKRANPILKCHHDIRRTFENAMIKVGVERFHRFALMNHSYAAKSGNVHDGYIVPNTEDLRLKVQDAAVWLMQCTGLSMVDGKLVQPSPTPPAPLKIAAA